MFERVVEFALLALAAYSTAGVLFALAFVTVGVTRLDAEAKGTGIGFRMLIFPGAAALWPALLRRWTAGWHEPRVETNPHRRAAEKRP